LFTSRLWPFQIGDSGKSTRELEKTIQLLKKVVERVQTENERLKKAPGPINEDVMAGLEIENHGLKIQLDDLRQKFGAQLSQRYESTQKGTQKMMADYEKIRKELRKVGKHE
jgi:centrosomal protein CEP290